MHLHLVRALEDLRRPTRITRAGDIGHDVQFYRTDGYLLGAVANFLADGVRAGQPLIVIATEAHRRGFARELHARGLDIDELLSGREAIWLDARETLAVFMESGRPNRDSFFATVGSVFERVLRKRNYLIVRGYGEMVDLLARAGNIEGSLLLEGFWNELAGKYAYSLLCGYSLDNFLHEAGAQNLKRVCGHHTAALPPENYAEASA